jgi:hypothetical protein
MKSAEREHAGMSCGASCAIKLAPLARHVGKHKLFSVFAALHESGSGTEPTFRDVRAMSAIEGVSDLKYSLRVFRLSTHA